MSSGFYGTVWRAVPNTTLCRPPFPLVRLLIAANDEHDRALDLLDDGYRLQELLRRGIGRQVPHRPPCVVGARRQPQIPRAASRGRAGGAQEGAAHHQAQDIERRVRYVVEDVRSPRFELPTPSRSDA